MSYYGPSKGSICVSILGFKWIGGVWRRIWWRRSGYHRALKICCRNAQVQWTLHNSYEHLYIHFIMEMFVFRKRNKCKSKSFPRGLKYPDPKLPRTPRSTRGPEDQAGKKHTLYQTQDYIWCHNSVSFLLLILLTSVLLVVSPECHSGCTTLEIKSNPAWRKPVYIAGQPGS